MIRVACYFDMRDFDSDKEFAELKFNDLDWVEVKEIFYFETEEFLEKAYSYDLVVFDYGGLELQGAGMLLDSIRRDIFDAITNNPNTAFITVSSLPDYLLLDEVRDNDLSVGIGWNAVIQYIKELGWAK